MEFNLNFGFIQRETVDNHRFSKKKTLNNNEITNHIILWFFGGFIAVTGYCCWFRAIFPCHPENIKPKRLQFFIVKLHEIRPLIIKCEIYIVLTQCNQQIRLAIFFNNYLRKNMLNILITKSDFGN